MVKSQKVRYILPFIAEDENVKDTTFYWSKLELGYHYTDTHGKENVKFSFFGDPFKNHAKGFSFLILFFQVMTLLGNIFFPFCMALNDKGQLEKTFPPKISWMTLDKG